MWHRDCSEGCDTTPANSQPEQGHEVGMGSQGKAPMRGSLQVVLPLSSLSWLISSESEGLKAGFDLLAAVSQPYVFPAGGERVLKEPRGAAGACRV